MDQIGQAIRQIIDVSEAEPADFLPRCYAKTFRRRALLSRPGQVPNDQANLRMNLVLQPAQVDVPILKAFGRQFTVLSGGVTKLLVYALRTVPRWGKVQIMKRVMGGMTCVILFNFGQVLSVCYALAAISQHH